MTPADTGRIPSLDGLRAISIAAVVIGHAAGTIGFPAGLGALIHENGYVDVANLGVRVFFVISGFLITGILASESKRTGGISLRRFYVRRTLQIFPAYYVFLAAVAAATVIGAFAVTADDLLHAATYTINYDGDRAWEVGHLWSLAVEEQFYLLWPLTLVLVGLRRAKYAAVLLVIAAPIFRAVEYRMGSPLVGNTFETTADAIAIGCLLALLRDDLLTRRWFRRLIGSWLAIGTLLAAGVVLGRWGPTNLLLSYTVINVTMALIVAHFVLLPQGRAGRALNYRPVVLLGVLSYSVYLWQQPFLNRYSTSPLTSFPLNLAIVAVAAVVSYSLVERPFLTLRPAVEARLARRSPQEAQV